MYEFLEGRIAARRAARLILDVGGVGYDLAVPLGASFRRPAATALAASADRSPIRVYVHLVVREDDHRLFGFPDLESRDLFRQILKVRGVGPNMALGLLSGLGAPGFLRAVLLADLKALTSVKGVGKKTAEQILLDLRDRAEALLGDGSEASDPDLIPRAPAVRTNIDDAIAALISLGYGDKDAKKNVERAAESVDANDIEALVKTALAGR